MPVQRSISRIVTPGPAVAGCQKVGHSFIEVIQADDFINSDPFIRLTDDRMEIGNKEIGAPHPHAGFEALGLLLEGAIRNRESGALLKSGDLTWLTAGSGIIHNENVETAAPVHALQLWLTLPKTDRWTAPAIQDLRLDAIPLRRTPGVEVRLYSGASGEYHAATQNHVPVTLADIQMSGGSVFSQEAPTWYNGFVYVLSGAARFGVGATLLHKGQIGWLDRPDDDRRALLSIAAHLQIYAVDFPDSRGIISEGRLIPVEGTLIGNILKKGVPEVSDFSDPSLKLPEGDAALIHAEGIRFGYAGPMYVHDRKLGVFSLVRKTNRPFTADDMEMADMVAQQVAIALSNAIAYKDIADLKDRLAKEKVYLEDEIRSELNFSEIVGKSAALRNVLKQIETVAPTDSTVLIYGETGTGKELIARAIHDRSKRRTGTFVKLNCAAIPTGLLESELFGHERGAFTGAISQRIGRFELANRGTIFLDEIGEIPLELQPKLLRVLQEREFERLGNSRTLRTDARLIAATNRDLEAMAGENKFRPDLYYRLNVFPVQVPALRDRPEDIPLLVRHFVEQFARQMNRDIDTIPAETMSALTRYSWPGNIRELQNLVERAVILSSGNVLQVPLQDLKHRSASAITSSSQTLEETERAHILAVLEKTKWKLSGPNGAAARLGLNRSTLQFRMKKLGIERPM
jgi:transcriptional regulator with GAF, ATPase, and Fis domain